MIKILLLMISSLLFASNITPIPLHVDYDEKKARLGKRLFFDTILSKDNTISCASCHNLPGSGANSTAYSFGVNATEGIVNSPTVLNSSFNFSQFWNGRAKDLKDQALGPIQNPIEMAENIPNIMKKLKKSTYKKDFLEIYKNGVTENNLAEVLAEFQKALFTPNSKFDKFLRGDKDAIDEQEKRGYTLFEDFGCISCHNGRNVGGNSYHKIGLFSPYKQNKPFLGRYAVTKRQRDKGMVKIPSLRNIELTAPYFHDGGAKSLKEAISTMLKLQIGISANKKDIDDIESFLKTLTGQSPEILKDLK